MPNRLLCFTMNPNRRIDKIDKTIQGVSHSPFKRVLNWNNAVVGFPTFDQREHIIDRGRMEIAATLSESCYCSKMRVCMLRAKICDCRHLNSQSGASQVRN